MNLCCKETSDTNKANLKGHEDCLKSHGLVSFFKYRSPDFLEQPSTEWMTFDLRASKLCAATG